MMWQGPERRPVLGHRLFPDIPEVVSWATPEVLGPLTPQSLGPALEKALRSPGLFSTTQQKCRCSDKVFCFCTLGVAEIHTRPTWLCSAMTSRSPPPVLAEARPFLIDLLHSLFDLR